MTMTNASEEGPAGKTLRLNLEFGGGAETLLKGEKEHKVSIERSGDEPFTARALLEWIRENLLADCDRPELLISNGNVRAGILVLLNDTDWEIMNGPDAELKDGDNVTFISTLHGG